MTNAFHGLDARPVVICLSRTLLHVGAPQSFSHARTKVASQSDSHARIRSCIPWPQHTFLSCTSTQ